jgi:hypothetical protein
MAYGIVLLNAEIGQRQESLFWTTYTVLQSMRRCLPHYFSPWSTTLIDYVHYTQISQSTH